MNQRYSGVLVYKQVGTCMIGIPDNNSKNLFLCRSGEFNYIEFVRYLTNSLSVGSCINPRCFRATKAHGNTDTQEAAEKQLREVFDYLFGNRNGFERKRSEHGGYEYLKVSP